MENVLMHTMERKLIDLNAILGLWMLTSEQGNKYLHEFKQPGREQGVSSLMREGGQGRVLQK